MAELNALQEMLRRRALNLQIQRQNGGSDDPRVLAFVANPHCTEVAPQHTKYGYSTSPLGWLVCTDPTDWRKAFKAEVYANVVVVERDHNLRRHRERREVKFGRARDGSVTRVSTLMDLLRTLQKRIAKRITSDDQIKLRARNQRLAVDDLCRAGLDRRFFEVGRDGEIEVNGVVYLGETRPTTVHDLLAVTMIAGELRTFDLQCRRWPKAGYHLQIRVTFADAAAAQAKFLIDRMVAAEVK